jgi:alpha/beta superfamily hydrolase
MSSFLTKHLTTPGEHVFLYPGKVGALEITLSVPEQGDNRFIALLGHPHSLQGGAMNNKVVTTLARTFKELAIPSLRFNFRGVGRTEGVYDAGLGESEDMLLLANQILQEQPSIRLMFAGFSFGSYVAYRAAAQCKHELLVSIAPPVHHYDFTEFKMTSSPWVIALGEEDELVALNGVLDFIVQSSADISLLQFADTTHFFHGKLIELKTRLLEIIRQKVVFL